MLAVNHEMSSFALVSVTAYEVGAPPPAALVLGLLGMFASDWPDIDAESSRIISMFWWCPPFDEVMKGFSALVWELCATDADRSNTAGDWGPRFRVHRGLWHSVWGALLTTLVWWALFHIGLQYGPPEVHNAAVWFLDLPYPPEVVISVTLGYGMLGHVLGDSCTDFGTAPLAPVLKWRGRRYVKMGLWEPLRFKVGKPVEHGLITPLCTAAAFWAFVGIWTDPWSVLALCGALAGFGFALLGVLVGKRKRNKLLGI